MPYTKNNTQAPLNWVLYLCPIPSLKSLKPHALCGVAWGVQLAPRADGPSPKHKIPSRVKLDTYDYSIYGGMQGQVNYISPDVLTEETKQGPMTYYRVRILITGTEFKGDQARQIQVRPGLTASVEIKAMERTVLSYLIKPLSKTVSLSMGEK